MPNDQPVTDTGTKSKKPRMRPREAATLVLYRRRKNQTCVLMGQRHAALKFFPDAYVFPGGRVDRPDGYVTPATDIAPKVLRTLTVSLSAHRARAVALAAIRETFEETGLLIGDGKPTRYNGTSDSWRAFFAAGGAPRLDGLDYICRAITPPIRPRRFDARFFLMDGEGLDGAIAGSGELRNVDWIPVADALELNLPGITKVILQRLDTLAVEPRHIRQQRPVPFHKMVQGQRLQFLEGED